MKIKTIVIAGRIKGDKHVVQVEMRGIDLGHALKFRPGQYWMASGEIGLIAAWAMEKYDRVGPFRTGTIRAVAL